MGDQLGFAVVGWYGVILAIFGIMMIVGAIAMLYDAFPYGIGFFVGLGSGLLGTWLLHWFFVIATALLSVLGSRFFTFVQEDLTKAIGWFS